MKFVYIILSVLSVPSYAAETKTKLELTATGYYYASPNREVNVNIKSLNKKLQKLGLDGLPEVVVMGGTNPGAYAKLLAKRVDQANKALNLEMHFNFYDQGSGESYLYKMTLCYRGDITGVPTVIENLRGSFLHPDEGILAIGAGSTKEIIDEAFKSRKGLQERFGDEYENHANVIEKWLKYSPRSTTAVVLSDYGQQGDGTELELTEIQACK